MRRESPVRFLGGGGSEMNRCYPTAKLQTLVQIKEFLDGTSEVAFRVPKEGRNPFIERVLKRFGYAPHGRATRACCCATSSV